MHDGRLAYAREDGAYCEANLASNVRKLRQVVGAAVQRMSNQAGQEMIAAFAEEAGLDITEINGAGSLGSGSGQK